MRAHRKRLREEHMRFFSLWRDHGLVFPSTVGTPLNHRNLARAFKDLIKRVGLPESTRLYDLRHTCATLLLARDVHHKYVQELLGHASITLMPTPTSCPAWTAARPLRWTKRWDDPDAPALPRVPVVGG
ncbi:tyrosine-type recombinase/integrase [Rubrobacter radiotolerans]|uniref:Tyrosine-type recombinase/integrase n=1 Tax=Rubrobacter radiotolerans TaxID=42256 RepID=A0AB35T4N0_RUBRA|nr:tyrosine-type recombinase/integrase [Rubrobacter radiotolerans]MDX5893063.1 tyrosine-type recombinase/integrase [Rubrobacter radiotolerans]